MHGMKRAETGVGVRGFTLTELLVVIAVVSIILGLLLVGIMRARRHARAVAARTEVLGIVTAFERYKAEYKKWPQFAKENVGVVITGRVARALVGDDAEYNPKAIPFMQFNRLNEDDDPVNPWGKVNTDRAPRETCYVVKLDTDYDNDIEAGSGGEPPTNALERTSIAVWTENGEILEGREGHIIGSWMP